MLTLARCSLAVAALVAVCSAHAQDELEVLPVQGNVFVIVGPGGNTAVQVGHEAVVLVDTQTAEAADRVLEAVKELSAKPIRHIVLTSADADHAGGAATLSQAGTYVRLIDTFDPRGASANASIIAHVNVLTRMSAPTGSEPPVPPGSWPSDTYFTDGWALFVNGEALQLLHVPAAHTDGDTMVFFRRSDVIVAGDVFLMTGYPRFDAEHGGSVAGVLDGLNRIIELAIPGENQEGGTVVIPGHGRLADETDVANYRDMVTIVRDRVQALVDNGMTLEQVLAARPTRDYDGIYAGSSRAGAWSADEFVTALYRELAGGQQ